MIGLRLRVPGEQFEYMFGLLAGEAGLVSDRDFMPTGGAEFIVDPDAFAGLDADLQGEVARWALPGSDIVAVVASGDGDGAEAPPGGSQAGPRLIAPPRAGPGSSRQAWAAYAAEARPDLDVTDLSRDEIMAKLEET